MVTRTCCVLVAIVVDILVIKIATFFQRVKGIAMAHLSESHTFYTAV